MSSYDDDDDVSVRGRRRDASGSSFGDFLLFRAMVAPWVLIIVFYIGLLVIMGVGIFLMIAGLMAMAQVGAAGLIGVFLGLLYLVFGPVILRIYVEFVIVVFRIHDVLTEIRDKL